ncbi:MAG: four helix bundle protein [Candidatus Cloacimonetes bacterium]|nr:four helix bundle protein [Candidatus Cloacimonadota bacterium]
MIKSLDDFQVYQLAMDIAEEIYPIIRGWDYFDQDTLGKQLIRAVDSIACPVE